MKKLLLALTISTMSVATFAQDVKIVKKSDPTTAINGTQIVVTASENDFDVKAEMEFVNLTSGQREYYIKREKLVAWNGLDQICDDASCYNAQSTTEYTTPVVITLNPNDTSLLKPQVQPNGDSFCAIYRYYIVDGFGTEIEYVDVKYVIGTANDCFLSTQEEENLELKVYPNPATDKLSIELNGTNGDYGFRIVDILGNVVYSAEKLNSTVIDISTLNSGVYFYSVINNGEAVKTQRLVVKK